MPHPREDAQVEECAFQRFLFHINHSDESNPHLLFRQAFRAAWKTATLIPETLREEDTTRALQLMRELQTSPVRRHTPRACSLSDLDLEGLL